MSKEQAQEAIIQISNIVDQWTDMNLDANDALELLAPLLKTVITYFDLDPTGDDEKKSNEKHELDLKTYDPGEKELQEDLFSKEETENDESKSKPKSKKEFAGSNGEIPF